MRVMLRSADVTYEAFDDEVVIVDLENGCYYSASGTAAVFWPLLMSGVPVAAAAGAVADAAGADASVVAADLDAFVTDLRACGIVVEASGGAAEAGVVAGVPVYRAPVLTRYDDLKDLLLLDPIHDVDEAGWPAARSD